MRSSIEYMEAPGMVLVNERCVHIHIISPAETFFLLIQTQCVCGAWGSFQAKTGSAAAQDGNLVEMWMRKPHISRIAQIYRSRSF